jgi:hypothetical protein
MSRISASCTDRYHRPAMPLLPGSPADFGKRLADETDK